MSLESAIEKLLKELNGVNYAYATQDHYVCVTYDDTVINHRKRVICVYDFANNILIPPNTFDNLPTFDDLM